MTRHRLEAFVDKNTAGFRVMCEDPTHCEQTVANDRDYGCWVVNEFDFTNGDILRVERDEARVIGSIPLTVHGGPSAMTLRIAATRHVAADDSEWIAENSRIERTQDAMEGR